MNIIIFCVCACCGSAGFGMVNCCTSELIVIRIGRMLHGEAAEWR